MNYEPYYQVGGSLEYQHPTYVVRQADQELYSSLRQGEFCYVLNSRQMGKSSLRVRMMKELQADGYKCVAVDMTRIGGGATAAEWYGGLVSELIRGLRLSRQVNFSSWWRQHDLLSPLQRLAIFWEDVLLTSFSTDVVVFLDEIDSIINVPFRDDFLGLIRSCYNRRGDDPDYKRLTFCLLGVATPSDLIADKQRVFNIGKPIELSGFAWHEVRPLLQGLEGRVVNPPVVLAEILDWTGGQPFLTQKLCQLILASEEGIPSCQEAKAIEEIVRSQILDHWEAQDEPEHLRTIRDRLLWSCDRRVKLLQLYRQILQTGKIVAEDTREQLELRLTGIVIQQQGYLQVYNRIYANIFNLPWVEEELAKVRPYSRNLNQWLDSGGEDDTYLLQGEALQAALLWAQNCSLSDEDFQFLTSSVNRDRCEMELYLKVVQEEMRLVIEKQQDPQGKREAQS